MFVGSLDYGCSSVNVNDFRGDSGSFSEHQSQYNEECQREVCPASKAWEELRVTREGSSWDGHDWRMGLQEPKASTPSTNFEFGGPSSPTSTLSNPPSQNGPSGQTFNWPPTRVVQGQEWRRYRQEIHETPLQTKRRKNREAAARCQHKKKLQLEQLRGDVLYLRDLVTQMKQEKHQLHLLDMKRDEDRQSNFSRSTAP